MGIKTMEQPGQHLRQFQEVTALSDPVILSILADASCHSFPAEKLVSSPGSKSEFYFLVLSGSIRVQVVMDSGRELILYNVRPGDGCILTTSCLISGDPFPAEGVTNSDTEVLALSHTSFDKAIDESKAFRRFVFANLGQRLADVISQVERMRTPAVERHLAGLLIKLSNNCDTTIERTHQELAADLGTVREVVSRHLKRFETNGWVKLGRGNIHIKDNKALAHLAGQ